MVDWVIGLIIFCIVYIIDYVQKRSQVYKGAQETFSSVVKEPLNWKSTCILVPGLGNGTESFNWRESTKEQRLKTGIDINDNESLQDDITNLGYRTVCSDPPGYGQNSNFTVNTIDEYCSLIYQKDATVIIGHSIGARIAQYYADKYNIKCIMVDPTPDYILDDISYTKHIEHPDNIQYQKTYTFIQMIKSSVDQLKSLSWDSADIVYSIDDNDSRKNKKLEYFAKLPNATKVINGTHWVHITHPNIITDLVKKYL